MPTIFLVCTPIVAMWLASFGLAWIRTPARRGALVRRGRDLRKSGPRATSDPGLVDLSQRSAGYLLALRAGSMIRGIAYLAFILCGLLRPSLLIAIAALIALIWVYNHWQTVANAAFLGLTGDSFAAFGESALAYQFPSHRRGRFWNLAESSPALALSVTGLGLILAAGLSLADESDTLITPIPGIYAQHSNMPGWALGLALLAAGALLASAGAWTDRATKRRSMRRETALPSTSKRGSRVVFLRPFGVEELRVPAHQGPRRDGIALLLPRRSEFLEDVVTWLLWTRGEVLAIANPGAGPMRTVGAAHHAIQDGARWTAAVSKLLESASAIVLVPGTTPGVSWEYEQVQNNGDFARKALLVNPEPTVKDSAFLSVVGATPEQVQQLREHRLLALAAVPTPRGSKLLCCSLAEDVDYEASVEWFLRKELPKSTRSRVRILARLFEQVAGGRR